MKGVGVLRRGKCGSEEVEDSQTKARYMWLPTLPF